MKIEKSKIEEIVRLHSEIIGHLRTSLDKAIRIGQLLTEQKESLQHGGFTPWLKENIPFTDRTARNYMRLYRERDRIKTETVSDLKGAYALLADHQGGRYVIATCPHCGSEVRLKEGDLVNSIEAGSQNGSD